MLPSISWLSQWVSTDHPPHASLILTAAGGLGAVSSPVLRAPGCWSRLQAHLCRPPLLQPGPVLGQGRSCGSQKTVSYTLPCTRAYLPYQDENLRLPCHGLSTGTFHHEGHVQVCCIQEDMQILSVWNVAGAAEELNSSFHFILFCFTLNRHM